MRRSGARLDPILRLYVTDDIVAEVCRAIDQFNREFLFRYGPPVLFYGHNLIIHFHDITDFFSYVNRTIDNELSLFRVKKQAEDQVRELPNSDVVLKCLRRIRWNEPTMIAFTY